MQTFVSCFNVKTKQNQSRLHTNYTSVFTHIFKKKKIAPMAPFYDLVHIIYSSKIVDYELYKKKIFVLVVIVKCGK